MIQKAYKIDIYSENDFELWNDFVAKSENATFLFHRNFMEYHKDRFNDYSLLVYNGNDIIAVLPANRLDNELYSHQGLTYGGLIFTDEVSESEAKQVVDSVLDYLKSNAINQLTLKLLPEFYSKTSTFNTILKKKVYKVCKSHMTLAVDLNEEIAFHKSKLKNYRKAIRNNVELRETQNFDDFWNSILQPKLKEKYDSKPVHSLSEISYLKEKFPNRIRQFNAYLNDKIIGGVTIFDEGKVVKSQYGAASQLGEDNKAIEYLFIELINKFKQEGKNFFSMGTVTDKSEKGYNEGMLKQKQELGCKVFKQYIYKITL